MIESKTIKERIENLPPIFKQRIENLSKIHPAILDYEISFCEQAIKIISYVEKRMECELSKTIITSDEYKSYFLLNLSYNLTFIYILGTIPNFYKKVQSGSIL